MGDQTAVKISVVGSEDGFQDSLIEEFHLWAQSVKVGLN